MDTQLQTSPLRPLAYLRISNTRNETSIDNQEPYVRSLCAAKGWTEPIIVADKITGTTVKRKGLVKVQQLAAAKAFDVLIAKDLVRMARTTAFIDWVQEHILKNGIRVWAGPDELDFTSAAGELQLTVMLAVLKFQARASGEAYKKIVPVLRERGRWLGHNPYGTMPGPEKGVFVKDPLTWPALEIIFERDAKGLSQSSTARLLREQAYPTQHGGIWRQGTIALILASPYYRGISTDGRPLKDPCVPEFIRPLPGVKKPQVGKQNSSHDFILRGLVYSSWFTVTEGPEHYRNGPEPWRTATSGKNRVASYQRVTACSNGELFAVTPTGCDGQPFGSVKAEWLEKLILWKLRRLAAKDKGGLLAQRVQSGEVLAKQAAQAVAKRATHKLKLAEDALEVCNNALTRGLHLAVSDSVIETLDKQVRQAQAAYDAAKNEAGAAEAATETQAGPLKPEEVATLLVLTDELYRRGEFAALKDCLASLIDRIDIRLWRKRDEHPRIKRGEVHIYWKPLKYLEALHHHDTTMSLPRGAGR